MARLAITAAGGGIGAFFGGAAGAQFGMVIGGILGNAILGPEGGNQKQEGPRIQDLKIQTSAYGSLIPIVHGTLRLPGMVTWSSGIEETVHEDNEESGKGGGGPEVATTTYTYSASWELTFCRGPFADVRRIWFDAVLVYDLSDTASSDTRAASEQFEFAHFVYYPGDDDDAVDPTVSAYEGAANTPAGRGKARIVFTDVPLADYGNRIPNVTAELVHDVTVLLDFTNATPGTPSTPPNTVWALTDLPTRHYTCSEPSGGNGFCNMSRTSQQSLGEYEFDTEYTFRCDVRRTVGARHGYLYVRNGELHSCDYRFSLADGSDLSYGDPDGISSAHSVTDLGDGWYRASITFDTEGQSHPSFHLELRAGANSGTSPWSPQFTYQSQGVEIRNPSFATTLGVPFSVKGLPDVVSDICEDSGLSTALFDVTDLPGLDETHGEVRGYATGQQSGRSAIENLEKAHFFDSVETEGILKFVPRGGSIVATIDTEEMVVDSPGGSPLKIDRGDDKTLPKRVSCTYMQRDKLYQPGEAHAQRIGSAAEAEANTDLRMVLSDEEAAQAADVMLYAAYAERVRFVFALPISFLYLDPADLITITDGDLSYTVRLTGISLENLLVLRCQGVEENPELYVSNWTGAGGPADDATVGDPTETNLVMMDAPMLSEAQNGPLLQFAAGGDASAWNGARVYRSRDGGTTYDSIAAVTISAKIGAATDALATGQTATWDDVSTVNIDLEDPEHTLESRTDLAVLNGANAGALIHADGTVEVFQYANATLEGDGTWTLSRLLRGRRGTEHAISGHSVGDMFVFLSRGYLHSWATTGADIGLSRKFKGVSVGTDIADATAANFSYTGVNLRPFSPVHIAGARDGSNNLTVTCTRRSRFTAKLLHTPQVGETSEAYELDVISGSTVLRTITAITPSFSYTAAQQTTDGLTPGDPVEVNIYQLSEIIGRGYPGNATV